MIGYLGLHTPPRLLFRRFRAHQCGLCHTLGAEYGLSTRMLAGQDLVFYAIFLEAMSGEHAAVERRACVVAPVVTSLPSVVENPATTLAAAFGVWMMAEKARDDWEDDGGLHRWVAVKALGRAAGKAQAVLEAHGFPVAEVKGWLARQVEVEATPSLPLEEALRPTEAIARLAFGFAARHRPERREVAERLGAAIGRFLFWMDNALDIDEDAARGGYNALIRATDAGSADPAAWRRLAAARADAVVDELEGELSQLEASADRAFLRAVLVDGFREKVQRFSAAAVPPTRLLHILPPHGGLVSQVRKLMRAGAERAFASARRVTARRAYRVQLALAWLLYWLLPGTGHAERWWPMEPPAPDPNLLPPPVEVLDTGAWEDIGVPEEALAGDPVDGGEGVCNVVCNWCCDACYVVCSFGQYGSADDACESNCDFSTNYGY